MEISLTKAGKILFSIVVGIPFGGFLGGAISGIFVLICMVPVCVFGLQDIPFLWTSKDIFMKVCVLFGSLIGSIMVYAWCGENNEDI